MRITDIEVVEDRTAGSLADEGFLRVKRLLVRSVREDGSRGEPYTCDVLSRQNVDAVAVLLYDDLDTAGRRDVRVVLKDGARPAVTLRRDRTLVQPDRGTFATVTEMCAGMLEPEDQGPDGVERRAAAEAREECGADVSVADVRPLGAPMFPSPGVTDEKVYFASAPVVVDLLQPAGGDGSGMEEGTRTVVLTLREAIAMCRSGEIPDMKTEIALLRLADALGYLPQLDAFVEDLPADVQDRYAPTGS